jgi:hypothetical protein
MGPLALYIRHPDGDGEIPGRRIPLDTVKPFMLKKNDRIIGANRSLEQPLGISRKRGDDNTETGDLGKQWLEGTGVLSTELIPSASGHADSQRQGNFAAKHVANDGGMVHDLVESNNGKIDGHQFGNRTQPSHGSADSHPDNSGFGNGRIDYPLFPEFRQETPGDLERAFIEAHVLSQKKNGRVPRHFFMKGLIQGFSTGNFSHGIPIFH